RCTERLDRGDPGDHLDFGKWLEPARDAQAGVIKRRIAPDQERDAAGGAEIRVDLARPSRGDGIVPVIDAAAIILAVGIAHGKIELDQSRSLARQNARADFPPQLGEVGLLLALARNEDEIGGVDRLDRSQRELRGITAADADQGKREHDQAPASAPYRITAVAATGSWASCSASAPIV